MANVYLPQENELPQEKIKLTGLSNNKSFYEIKGIVLEILKELGIFDINFTPVLNNEIEPFWEPNFTAKLIFQNEVLGIVGKFKIDKNIVGFDLDFSKISKFASDKKIFTP